MCGIVGILGNLPVADRLIDCLQRLEYRGYDSAGIATLESGRLVCLRSEGKLRHLQDRLIDGRLNGVVGIGHTRWATHGRPSEANAHPHATDVVAVVHNGIIENFQELRQQLTDVGIIFKSDTDTEVVAHLVSQELRSGRSPIEAVSRVLPRLRGAFALVFLFDHEQDLLIGARRGSPLVVGHGTAETYLASDAIALAPLTQTIRYLEDGDLVVAKHTSTIILDATGRLVTRPMVRSTASALLVDKGSYRHFMAKELFEQPEVIAHTLEHYIDRESRQISLPVELPFDFAELSRLSILACGTAYYAASIAKQWFETYARLPVDVDIASEFRYRAAPLRPGDAALFVSQSGETADTLASLHYAREQSQHILSIVNVATSSIARNSDVVLPTLAGPEIGVASTKAFTCQLAVLACLAIAAGRARGVLAQDRQQRLIQALINVPRLVFQALQVERDVESLARSVGDTRNMLFLGRGISYPLALEGALKLKELSYIHAEGYAAGELKHGPIALVDDTMPVVVIAPSDHVIKKTASNMQEVAARGGRLILITDQEGLHEASIAPWRQILLPTLDPFIVPLVYVIPLQLFAYHMALYRGTDIDQPRNLAKSVTVE
ncbi:glutamine--fructose-6-phosphate transaminase (isomerizing) [Bradyrhizobium sp. HKCCYLS20291]|uniref:glutamine--fructose-6-phosphate transaminase (isomerizing) n=1 Tax=Bradyrhizobium sp. HKCCYLS20291 TaxID=3420766 RepID=UPI003EB807DC